MKAIILAAGLGSRLEELTKDRPKCLVEYKNMPLISYQLNAFLKAGINDIAVVGGYKFEVLKNYLNANFKKVKLYENTDFASSNMTYTMFCAREFMDDDTIISYSDIIYDYEFIELLKACKNELSVMVDKNWLELWKQRFSDPLSDAESMEIQDGFIKELGKKVTHIDKIDAQYIGLFKFNKSFLSSVFEVWDNLDKNRYYDSKNWKNIYMTSFLTEIINKFDNAKAIFAPKNWLEIDQKTDLEIDIF
ncbi:phosphocholine cytidylyltransferase family protein [Campylobacter fetus]|uniref:Phosphocholine cytidylyltransferase family protein n=1 Tax=Campylobacter fetus TaxID=196 RepID=A0A5L4IRT7_CAMFE|nr:phosphocholine cytidylyltransferase family protein [Campylobacter fetus]EAH8300680.1 phosphocholine cytidylyltransferase family protein [Campylobacter fetus]EAI4415491.1 phosphocholine cytidylyltransferase family protein [Campylobacter fetus]EAI7233312.1 phosphocholine cytidylyltransferase family protein [Campylobacter fetus]EAJ5691049.1 phosphocholine cytidylyltransferase family protein [Campylobacter fetus]EAK0428914.1 phosphocholine cytidylyltransferase family protein [Campylobacter fetu